MPRRRRSPLATATLVVVALLAACGGGTSSSSATTAAPTSRTGRRAASTTGPPVSGSITVSAAASLTEAFDRIETGFEAAHPGAEVTTNFGSSGKLATQITTGGAPVDVAAFADERAMATLADASLLDGPSHTFATNRLVIVTKPGNPRHIASLADLPAAGTVALCATSAPCGSYAEQALAAAHVDLPASEVTRGEDVKSTLGAVTNGDADAGIVYVTDARAAGGAVARVAVPSRQNVVARYPIAALTGGDTDVAQAFVAYVLGPEGQAALRAAGFGPP